MGRKLNRRGTKAIAAVAAAGCLVVAAPAAADAPKAHASAETLVSYLTKGKLKPGKRIAYRVVCSADCQLTVTSELVLKDPNLGPVSSTGAFAAGQVAEAFLKLNGPAQDSIKDHIGSSKLRTSVTATSTVDGSTDTDNRTFKFKR